jgi:3-dehydroquinate dehydratase-2
VAKTVYFINGPNLNLLGTREPEIYGTSTLKDIENRCRTIGSKHGLNVVFFQSNHEGVIIDRLQEAIDVAQGVVINAAAYTHTSVAIHDALRAFNGFKIEFHISNPHLRESFRHVSFISPVVDAVVAGLGVHGYELVLDVMASELNRNESLTSA